MKLIFILCLALVLTACGGAIAGIPTHDANGKLVCPAAQVLDILDTGVPVCRYQ